MVDASHANSRKNHENQPKVFADIAGQIANGENRIIGVMAESNLVAGRQDLKPGHDSSPTASRSPTPASTGRRRSTCSKTSQQRFRHAGRAGVLRKSWRRSGG